MKYSLLVVDDEYQIRESSAAFLRSKFDDVKIETASNGEEALRRLQQSPVDAMLLDIKMRKMDGLTLLEELRKIGRLPLTAIVSGFPDFSFARKAIEYRVRKYLVKPFLPSELQDTVKELLEQVQEQRKTQLEYERLRQQARDNINVLRDEFFNSVILGEITQEEFTASSDYLGIPVKYPAYQCAVFWLEEGNSEDREIRRISLRGAVAEILKDSAVSFDTPDGLTVLVNVENIGSPINKAYLEQVLRTQYIEDVIVGVGLPRESVGGIAESYNGARAALRGRFLSDGDSIIWEAEETQVLHTDTAFDSLRFSQALQMGDSVWLRSYLEKNIASFREGNANIREVEAFCMQVLSCCGMTASHMGMGQLAPDYRKFLAQMQRLSDLESLESTVWSYVEALIATADPQNVGESQIAARLRTYIDQNYAQALKVKMLSEYFHMNADYLGKLFKREYHETISEYLNVVRIQHAVQMFQNTSYSISQIAEKTGFRDQTYFSTVFKKLMGVSPSQYRNMK